MLTSAPPQLAGDLLCPLLYRFWAMQTLPLPACGSSHRIWPTATRLSYQPPAGVVAEFHSHGGSRAFFSATDDRDEQGFRI